MKYSDVREHLVEALKYYEHEVENTKDPLVSVLFCRLLAEMIRGDIETQDHIISNE